MRLGWAAGRTSWKAWLQPTFLDCFFAAVIVWLFIASPMGWKALLMDGDTGWHIRTGEYILDHARIPHQDLYSFTKAGAEWLDWEWLSDVIFGLLFRLGGLRALVLFSALIIGIFATVLLRIAIWRGANVMIAIPLVLLGVGSSTIHFLARPHLFTLVLLPVSLWLVDRDRRSPGRLVWALVPITAVWANLHGGFVAFLACLAVLIAGLGLEQFLWQTASGSWARYSLLLVGCGCATVMNPFGIKLHLHIADYLKNGWIRDVVQEFQAPTFRSEGQFQFEILLIVGLLLAACLISRRRIGDALVVIFLAHSALTSVRHAPLYASVAATIAAAELTRLWAGSRFSQVRNGAAGILMQLGLELKPKFLRCSAWVVLAACLLMSAKDYFAWPNDFPKEIFPVAMVHRHASVLSGGRVLTTDQWADYLIFTSYPLQKVFVDGRSDFYGERIGRDYLNLMQGAPNSEDLLRRYAFTRVLIPVDWPLAGALKKSSSWFVKDDDGHSILFMPHSPNENRCNCRTVDRRG